MIAPNDLRFWWVPLVFFAGHMVCVFWNVCLVLSYRRKGLIPPNSLRSQIDVLYGRYDHLPKLRGLRRATMVFAGAFVLAGVAIFIANSPRRLHHPVEGVGQRANPECIQRRTEPEK